MTMDLIFVESSTLKELEEWELRKEMFWKKKSPMDWLQEGDMSTTFFHNTVKAHRFGNSISSLVLVTGAQLSSNEDISLETIMYFSNIFSREEPIPMLEARTILDCIPCLVSNEINRNFL